jgi:hypothetical protein
VKEILLYLIKSYQKLVMKEINAKGGEKCEILEDNKKDENSRLYCFQ